MSSVESKKKFERLPSNVRPLHYDVKLKPDFSHLTFEGQVKVDLKVNDPFTSYIEINCDEIVIEKAEVLSAQEAATSNEATSIVYDKHKQTCTLKFARDFSSMAGDLKLVMGYSGVLNDRMKGFYRSVYKNKVSAVTHFEPTFARMCLPCWDEPEIKSTFDITLVVPQHHTALSNMHEVSEEIDEDGNKVVKFATTPIMSTYLLAAIVGEYDYVEDKTKDGIVIRVYTPLGKKHEGTYALEVAVKALEFYTCYFGIGYPMKKLDLIAISDFAIGAMENWGLVTYREPALLIDMEKSASVARQYVSLVVCHELAHQWFGNLVTMEWWTDLWLKEGFASFMEYLATDHHTPQFHIWNSMVVSSLIRSLDLDSLDSSHPIEIEVGHPDEIKEIFDAISYNKGASIIRMLHNWLGAEDFRSGLHDYLLKYSYANTKTINLWKSLESASGKPVEKVMSTWTQQMGYPVLDVAISSTADDCVTLEVTQNKYSLNQNASPSPSSWLVPITMTTSNGKQVQHLLRRKTEQVKLDGVDPQGWIKLNVDFTGFYRVNYSEEMMLRIVNHVDVLPILDRLNICNDLFALATCGKTSTVRYLRAIETSYKPREMSYPVWREICTRLVMIRHLTWNDELMTSHFDRFTSELMANVHRQLGWQQHEQDDHMTTMLRALAISNTNNKEIAAECERKFRDHVNGKEELSSDLREAVYRKCLSQKDAKQTLEHLFKLYEESDSQEEENRIGFSMGSVNTREYVERVLQFLMSEKVRDCEKPFFIRSLASTNRLGCFMCWDFVKSNWSKFVAMYRGSYMLSRIVQYTTENFSSKEKLNDVKSFFAANPTDGIEMGLKQSVEKIEQQISWWERDRDQLKQWLVTISQQQSAAKTTSRDLAGQNKPVTSVTV